MQAIDFMLPGFARCGTTTLFEHLRRHPQVWIPPYKECTIDDYTTESFMKQHFPGNYKGKTIGHLSPMWILNPRLAYNLFGDIKIIIATRDKQERTDSWIKMLNERNEPIDHDYIEMINQYDRWIDFWKDLFSDVFVYDLSEMQEDPKKIVDEIYKFLGLKPFKPKGLGVKYNSRPGKMMPLMKFLKKLELKRFLPQGIIYRISYFLYFYGRSSK